MEFYLAPYPLQISLFGTIRQMLSVHFFARRLEQTTSLRHIFFLGVLHDTPQSDPKEIRKMSKGPSHYLPHSTHFIRRLGRRTKRLINR